MQLGPYTLLAELSEGGVGKVFVARRANATELCVLKTLKPEIAEVPTAAARIRREANVTSQLDHRGIARTLDAGAVDDIFYIASELVVGTDVDRLLFSLWDRGTPAPPNIALGIAVQILDALDYAHTAKDGKGRPLRVVHRDLSPRNVMLDLEGRVKVIDFGLSTSSIDDFRTAPGMLMGTPRYLSPEQADGTDVDARTDLYALSAMLFELLEGRRLVPRAPLIQTLQHVIADDVPPLEHCPELDGIVRRGLTKRARERWPSAAAYAEALRSAGEVATDAEIAAFVEATLGPHLDDIRRQIEPFQAEAREHDPTLSATQTAERPEPVADTKLVESPRAPQPRTRPWWLFAVPAVVAVSAAALTFALSVERPAPQPPPVAARQASPVVVERRPDPAPPAPTPKPPPIRRRKKRDVRRPSAPKLPQREPATPDPIAAQLARARRPGTTLADLEPIVVVLEKEAARLGRSRGPVQKRLERARNCLQLCTVEMTLSHLEATLKMLRAK